MDGSLFARNPSSYISGKGDAWVLIVAGSPISASGVPLDQVREAARQRGIRDDVAWSAPSWVSLP